MSIVQSARQGFALVTSPSKLGVSFSKYLLKNTSLPVVITSKKDQDSVLQHFKDIPEASTRLHCVPCDVAYEKQIARLSYTLRKKFPKTPLRIMLALRDSPQREEKFSWISKDSVMKHFERTVVAHELLIKNFHSLLPTKETHPDSSPFEVSTTDEFKLPAHGIWAMEGSRAGSITSNNASRWYSHGASSAATMHLAKSFDNRLSENSGDKALAIAFHAGTFNSDPTLAKKTNRKVQTVLDTDEAVEKIMSVLANTSASQGEGRGLCWDYNGEEVKP